VKVSIIKDCPGLGDRIRELRGDRPVSELADKAKLSASQWNRIESEDVKYLPETTLERIAIALDTQVDKLIEGDTQNIEGQHMNLKNALIVAAPGDYIHAKIAPNGRVTYDSEAVIKRDTHEPGEDWIFVCDHQYLSGYEGGIDKLLEEVNRSELA
jgi:transcriptional regulator with XRE-family HTH domain